MPRETIDITRFTRGIMSAVETTDLPLDAAIWAQELDPDRYPGELANRAEDAPTHTSLIGENMRSGAKFIPRTSATNLGENDLCYYEDSGTGLVKVIKDFPGTAESSPTGLGAIGTGKTVAIEPHNDCAYIGYGHTSAETTKWVGYIPYGQLDTAAAPDDLIGTEAACAPPESLKQFYKVVCDGTHYYGIEWQGKYIWKYDLAGDYVAKSDEFESLQGLALYDATYIVVLDFNQMPGQLVRVSKSTLTTTSTAIINATPKQIPFWNPVTQTYAVNMVPSDLVATETKAKDR